MAKYINPFTDFGFKCIFGREESKPFLVVIKDSVVCPWVNLWLSLSYKFVSQDSIEARDKNGTKTTENKIKVFCLDRPHSDYHLC